MHNHPDFEAIESLEPKSVWRFFAGIAAVPRPSKHEGRIRGHIRVLAEQHGFSCHEDKVGNIVVEVPASPGCESAPITVLQGHLDMVCEADVGTRHDFDKDPIRLIMDECDGEQIVRADKTTLGADNGIGLAMAFAAATSPDVVHGPLELLFTVDEEAGMTGAKALSPSFFRGRTLLNLDSEEDDALYIGCAGGCDTTMSWRFPLSPAASGDEIVTIKVAGLRGGHSGGDIHLGRGNAVKLLARTLLRAGLDGVRLANCNGGSKRNAIPREAGATVVCLAAAVERLRKAALEVQAEAQAESSEAGCTIAVERTAKANGGSALSAEDTRRLALTISALPYGVMGLHPRIAGLVETSNNVATVETEPAEGGRSATIKLGLLSRSSSDSRMKEVLAQMVSVGQLAGAATEHANEYPGWAPNLDSPVLAICRQVYEELFGSAPNATAIHAGLECGIIGERVGKIDTVSFGPCIRGAHSPEERVYVKSVGKSWQYLVAVLARLAGK